MKRIIFSMFLTIILLTGCKTKEIIKYIEIPKVITRIDSVTVERTDSFIEFQKGDTIYQYRWKTLFKDRINIKHDSISVPIEVQVIKEVKVDKHDFIWYSGLALYLFLVGFIGFKIKNMLP